MDNKTIYNNYISNITCHRGVSVIWKDVSQDLYSKGTKRTTLVQYVFKKNKTAQSHHRFTVNNRCVNAVDFQRIKTQ